MLWGSDERKDRAFDGAENKLTAGQQTAGQQAGGDISREELFAQNEDARKVYEEIMSLRKSVQTLKSSESSETAGIAGTAGTAGTAETAGTAGTAGAAGAADTAGSAGGTGKAAGVAESSYIEESEAVIAAKHAILAQAEKDAYEEKLKHDEALRKEEEARRQQQKVLMAQRRAAMIEEEAERKRKEAIEAERRAKEVSRKIALEAMEAERHARAETEEAEDEEAKKQRQQQTATQEQIEEFFDERLSSVRQEADLEMAKHALLSAQKEQNTMLELMSHTAEMDAKKFNKEQQNRMKQQQKLLREEQFKLGMMLEEMKNKRLESIEQDRLERELRVQQVQIEKLLQLQEEYAKKAERARMLKEEEEQRQREKEEWLQNKQRIQAEKLAQAQRKKEEKQRRARERELIRKARKDAAQRAKLAKLKMEEKSRHDAELGGGIVNIDGLTITTEIKEIPQYTWKDYFNIRSRKERKASSEAEKRELQEEREKRTEEARALVDMSIKQKTQQYEESAFGKKIKGFKEFCDRRKKPLLTAFAVVIMLSVGVAGVFNYYTAYAYSYNGQQLGFVKEKDDVLMITDLVQGALTQDKHMDVIIDAKDDIQFERVPVIGEEVKIDTTDDVLKRLTYMGDLNVKAFGIYVNGDKVGAVESKEVAAEVLQEIKDKYTSGMEGAVVEEAVIIEDVEIKKSNTDLQDVSSKDEMVDILCTSGQKETTHEVIVGETLADLAKLYSMTEAEILDDNEGVDPKRLQVGSELIIKQQAPAITVKITEMVTYEQEIDFEVQKKESKKIYEGYTELKQKGQKGLNEVTSRLISVNGERIEEQPLVTTVKEAPVPKIILVGSKERPPTVGSGKYICPLTAGYTLTSPFGMRWGSLHTGIDLALPVGNEVVAADGGTVTQAGYSGGYGYLVVINHQNGMETYYAHNSELLVKEGDKVFQGQQIAWSGNTGRSTGPHLHFEIRVDGNPVDPQPYLPE